MPEDTLKIRVDVDTAPIRLLGEELKRLREARKDIDPLSGAFTLATANVNVLRDRIGELNKDVSTSHEEYFKLGTTIRQVGEIAIKAFAVFAATDFLKEIGVAAARVQLLRQELEQLGRERKFDPTELMKQLEAATGGTVTQTNLLQIAYRAIQLGNIDLNKLPAIMERLEYRSKLLGIETRELFDQFIRGAETGSKRFQVQFGLLYDVKKAEEDYARSIGTTVAALSDEEHNAIRVRVAFAELLKQQVDSNSEAAKTIENSEKIAVTLDKARLAVGELTGSPIIKFLGSVALEAAIAAEALMAYARAEFAAAQAAWTIITFKFDFSGVEKQIKEIGKIGDTIRVQTKMIGDLWLDTEKKVDNSKKKIGETPAMPAHVSGAEELKKVESANEQLLQSLFRRYDAERKAIEEQTRLLFPEYQKGQERNLNLMLILEDAVNKADTPRLRNFLQIMKEIREEEMRPKARPEQKGVKPLGVPTVDESEMELVSQSLRENGILVESLMSGFQAMGQTIQTEFVDKIIGATSLFQQFARGVISSLAQIVEQMAAAAVIAGILSFLTGGSLTFAAGFKKLTGFAEGGILTEPTIGVGLRSGTAYSFAENGPERIAPLLAYSRPESITVHHIVEMRAKGRDLGSVIRLEGAADNRRKGNG